MTSQTATETLVAPARRRPRAGALTLGVSTVYLSIIVLIPIAAIFAKGFEDVTVLVFEPFLVPDTSLGLAAGAAFGLFAGTIYYFTPASTPCA